MQDGREAFNFNFQGGNKIFVQVFSVYSVARVIIPCLPLANSHGSDDYFGVKRERCLYLYPVSETLYLLINNVNWDGHFPRPLFPSSRLCVQAIAGWLFLAFIVEIFQRGELFQIREEKKKKGKERHYQLEYGRNERTIILNCVKIFLKRFLNLPIFLNLIFIDKCYFSLGSFFSDSRERTKERYISYFVTRKKYF